MRDEVAKLVDLQAIDDEARDFKKERDDLTEKIDKLKELLGLMTKSLGEKQAKLDEATRWYEEKNQELQADKDKVTKAKIKLQSVTKNKEYMAMQREIEILRKQIVDREDEILNLLKTIEEVKGNIAMENTKIEELTAEVASEEKDNAERIAALEGEIAKVESRKTDVVKGIRPNILSRYRRISKARDGIAIVECKNKACSACNFACPAQQVVRIELGNTMEVCRNCSRMLYWPDEPEEAEAAAPA